MGVCTCNGANNEIVAKDIAVPLQVKLSTVVNKEDSTEKQNKKKMIHFTKKNNNNSFSLTSVLNEMLNDKLLITSTSKNNFESLLNSPDKEPVEYSQRNKKNEILKGIMEKEGAVQANKSHIRKSLLSVNINQITNDHDDINLNLPHKHSSQLMNIGKDIECSFSSKIISAREENILMKGLKGHFLFWGLREEIIKTLIDMMSLIQIEDDTYIFREKEKGSSFFIIKSGSIEIKTKTKARSLNRGSTFGELGLLQKDCEREYSAVAKGQIELYALSFDTFAQVINDYNVGKEESVNPNYIENNYLLKELPQSAKQNLILLAKLTSFNASELIISTVKKANPIEPLISNNKTMLFVNSGELSEIFYLPELKTKVSVGELAGLVYTMFKPRDKTDYEIIANENSECYILPEAALIEALGANYRYEILLSFFNSRIVKSTLIKELLGNHSTDTLFQGFNIKEYKANEIVINHSNFENKKMCMLLNGDVISSKNNKTKLSKGILYGDKLINSNEE